MKQLSIMTVMLASTILIAPTPGYTQATDIGQREYINSCADCHGEDGKGRGPVAEYLKPKVPDLTVLAKNSGGVFPFARVYDTIDGRQQIGAHGPRNMLVWGTEYRAVGDRASGGYAAPSEVSSYARGRIIALIGYIYSLQIK
jgi:hypothetical protein